MKAALLVVAALLAAGCVALPSSKTPAAPTVPLQAAAALAAADANQTGSLVVLAMFKDRTPLADVNVTVDGNRSATSDADGKVRFDGLAVGVHNVSARKAAHRTAQLEANVAASAVSTAEVLLEAEGSDQHSHEKGLFAHRDLYRFEGHFDCSATYVIITGDCEILLRNVSEQTGAPAPPNATTSRNVIEFPLDGGWRELVVEMNWSAPATSAEDGMSLGLEPAQAPADGHAAKYATAHGVSPLRIDLKPGIADPTATTGDEPNAQGGEVIRARAFVEGLQHNPGGTTFLGVGFAKDQSFQIAVSVFYLDGAPDNYTAVG